MQEEKQNITQVKPHGFKEYLSYLGPASIITMAIMGPGTIGSMLTSGSSLGPQVGWMVLFSALTSWWFLALSNKTTCLTGRAPLETLYDLWTPLAMLGFLLAVIPQIFIVMVQGATAGQTFEAITGIKSSIVIWPALLIIILVFYQGKFSAFKVIAKVFVLIMCLFSIVFAVRLLLGPELSFGEAVKGLVIPKWPDHPGVMGILAGVVGGAGTWGVLAFHGYSIKQAGNATPDKLWVSQYDAFVIGGVVFLLFSLGIFWAASGVFYGGEVIPKTAPQAAELFVPVLGQWAHLLFYAGFVGAIFGTMSGTNILFSTFVFGVLEAYKYKGKDWSPRFENKKFRVFTIISLLVLCGFGAIQGRPAILPALVWSLGVATVFTPPGLALWIYLTNSEKFVGQHKNRWYWNVGLVLMFLLFTFIAIKAAPGLMRNPFRF